MEKQADELQIRPGTLARILVHAALTADMLNASSEDARTALDRLVRRSRQRTPADAVRLVADGRVGLEPHRRA